MGNSPEWCQDSIYIVGMCVEPISSTMWESDLHDFIYPDNIGGNQTEVFTQKFWINVAILAILVVLLLWWIMYLYASLMVTAVAYLATYMTNFN